MGKLSSSLRPQILLCAVLIVLAGCGKDDDGNGDSVESSLAGLWTSTQSTVDASVGAQTLTEYFENVLGLSPAEAGTKYLLWQSGIQAELIGSITFKSDHTYASNFGSSPDTGTWALGADETTLTLSAGTPDEQVLTIVSLSGNTLIATLTEEIQQDLDNDSMTPDVLVKVDATITLTH